MWSKPALHDVVVVTNPIVIEPCNITIEKGARGKVIDIDPDTKDLTIRLTAYHPDLLCQRNIIALRANEAGRHIKRPKPSFSRRGRYLRGIAFSAAIFFAGLCAGPQPMVAQEAECALMQSIGVSPKDWLYFRVCTELNSEFAQEKLMYAPVGRNDHAGQLTAIAVDTRG